jgi:CDP-diacylglycerol---serine O-phosphatidyltransferase
MKKDKHEKERLRKGIYILPNIFTSLNLFCGFLSIISAIEGNYEKSALFIIGGMIFDILDGKVARATRTTSQFGIEYDSLADLISFGLAPGIMMYLWILEPLGKLGWLAALIYLACGALRLARFNTNVGTADNTYFTGLPIPAAAAMTTTIILLAARTNTLGGINPYLIYLILAGMYALSFLMVGSIKYVSFKKMPPVLTNAKNFNILVIAVLMLVFIVQEPAVALFSMISLYIASGPIRSLRHIMMSDHDLISTSETPEKKEATNGDGHENNTYHIG